LEDNSNLYNPVTERLFFLQKNPPFHLNTATFFMYQASLFLRVADLVPEASLILPYVALCGILSACTQLTLKSVNKDAHVSTLLQ
jgi:hypothetical protein